PWPLAVRAPWPRRTGRWASCRHRSARAPTTGPCRYWECPSAVRGGAWSATKALPAPAAWRAAVAPAAPSASREGAGCLAAFLVRSSVCHPFRGQPPCIVLAQPRKRTETTEHTEHTEKRQRKKEAVG